MKMVMEIGQIRTMFRVAVSVGDRGRSGPAGRARFAAG
jgi:hypothetical protein